MKTINLKILPKNQDFISHLHEFLKSMSTQFYRDKKIDEILENSSINQIYLIESILFGCTYNSDFRLVNPLSSATHIINEIDLTDENNIIAKISILDSPSGVNIQYIDTNILILRPVYSDLRKILTFDIDFISYKTTA